MTEMVLELNDILNIAFFCLIIGIFIYQSRHLVKMRKLKKEILNYNNLIKKVKKEIFSEEWNVLQKTHEISDESIEKNRFQEYLQGLRSGYQWDMIKENIDDYTSSLKLRGVSSVDSKIYFNEINILERNFNIQSLNQIGPTLIGIGILGTFTGLTMGLSKMGFDNIDTVGMGGNLLENSEVITKSIQQQLGKITEIISSLSIAFHTSIFGMLSSLIFTGIYKRLMGNIIVCINQIEHNLSLVFPTKNRTEEILLKMDENLSSLKTGLSKNLGIEVAKSIESSTQGIFGRFGKEFESSVQTLGKDIARELKSVFNENFIKIFEELEKALKESHQNLQMGNETFKKLVTKLPKVVDEFEKLNETSIFIYENTQKSMMSYNKIMDQTENFVTLINSIERSQNFLNQSIEKLEKMVNENENRMMQFSASTAETHKTLTESLNKGITTLNIELRESLGNFKESVNEYSRNVMSIEYTTHDIIKELKKEFEHKENYTKEQNMAVENIQKQITKSIGDSLKQYDEEVSKIMLKLIEITENVKIMGKNN